MTITKTQVEKNTGGSKAKNAEKKSTKSGRVCGGKTMALLSRLAKALMVPIAILPFAALINRFGDLFQSLYQYDHSVAQDAGMDWLMWIGIIIQKPGAVVFDNLALLFAIGIGFGLSEDFRGEAALAAAVAFLGIQAMTGSGALAELFYGGTLKYTDDSIHNVIDPVLKVYENNGFTLANLNTKGILETADGQSILYNSLLGSDSYFAGKSSLLYFVKGWESVKLKNGEFALVPDIQYMLDVGVLGGIVAGSTVAFLYNRYKTVNIPEALSFFGGRRFIPMLAILSVWVLGFGFSVIWPWCQLALLQIGTVIASPSHEADRVLGFGVYAFFNRLVQPLGLHHIINTFLWFQFPIAGPTLADLNSASGAPVLDTIIFGDITAFQKGVLGSGIFQAGFFPLYMGGYVGIAAGLTWAAPKKNRKEVGIFFTSTAFVAFLTGIDEPILFAFMFVAPQLWILNCILVPIFGMIITAQHISLGFGFSAGLVDYLISLPSSWQMSHHQFLDGAWLDASRTYAFFANPLWIFVWSAIMAVIYAPIFYFVTVKLDIPTEGREKDADGKYIVTTKKSTSRGAEKYNKLAQAVIDYVGIEKIKEVTNCTTRLRLTMTNSVKGIDESALKSAGFNGIIKVGDKALQLIVGTDVEYVTEALLDKIADAKKTITKK